MIVHTRSSWLTAAAIILLTLTTVYPTRAQDCNANGVLDALDVDPADPDGDGVISSDCNLNGLPDECEIFPYETTTFASDGADLDFFGLATSMSGRFAVFGSYRDDDAGSDSGSAYVFEQMADTWQQVAKLTADDAQAGALLGTSVSIDGDTVFVGAPGADGRGAVYVFERIGSDWQQTQKLWGIDTASGDAFGGTLAISGDVAIISAYRDDVAGSNTGSVYFYRRNAGVWQQEAKKTASNHAAAAEFGISVAIDQDAAAVRARNNSAYIFRFDGSDWNEEAILPLNQPPQVSAYDQAISISGDTMVGGDELQKSAHVFERVGGVWQEVAMLTAIGGHPYNVFGCSVSVSGDAILVGAWQDSNGVTGNGAAYLYRREAGVWTQVQRVAPSDPVNGGRRFGNTVFLRGGTGMVSTSYGVGVTPQAGTVQLFNFLAAPDCNANGVIDDCDVNPADLDGNGSVSVDCNGNLVPDECELSTNDCNANGIPDDCDIDPSDPDGDSVVIPDCNANGIPDDCDAVFSVDETILRPSDAEDVIGVGGSVSVSGGAMVIGAMVQIESVPSFGAVYVYRREDDSWQEEAKLVSTNPAAEDGFGFSADVDGGTVIVGANFEESGGLRVGAAYVFRRDGIGWHQEAKLSDPEAEVFDRFGSSVAVNGNVAVVGADGDDEFGNGAGAVHVFRRSGSVWSRDIKLTAGDAASGDGFGRSVAICGQVIVVGAPWDDGDGGSRSGAAYVFRRTMAGWIEEAKLRPSLVDTGMEFGECVSIDGDVIAIGAPCGNGAAASSGAAYIFRYMNGSWLEASKLVSADGQTSDQFGASVSIDRDTVLIGAIEDDGLRYQGGAAYLYRFANGVWNEEARIFASDAENHDGFGASVSIHGHLIAAGAPYRSETDFASGIAYAYDIVRDCNVNGIPDNCDIGGDMNGSGDLDTGDIDTLVETILAGGGCSVADVNHDGSFDSRDLAEFVADFLE